MRTILFILLLFSQIHALPFSLITKENNTSDPTLLVIAGIHGNEPGGYFAAAMLSQYYEVSRGNLWIVPDLNRPSIQEDVRGINGDMNRKFARIKKDDPDILMVEEIKKIITDKQVSLVLNLHDGHGFYRQNYEGTIFNPNSWGQTCVIDQCDLDKNQTFGNLDAIAKSVSMHLNNNLLLNHHSFDVRNTNTKFDDEAMQLSLTYYAVTHNKPAFAIETSKNLSSLAQKVYYQLNAIEAYMQIMGISFRRNFELTQENITNLLNVYGSVTINNKISLNLSNIKKYLSFIPLESNKNAFVFSHPLGSLKRIGKTYVLYIGNRIITQLGPDLFANKECGPLIEFDIDGNRKKIAIASETVVNTDFKVKANSDLRVNIIGFTDPDNKDENEKLVSLSDLNGRFSIDNAMKCYRVELYDNDSFCGMVVVHFK